MSWPVGVRRQRRSSTIAGLPRSLSPEGSRRAAQSVCGPPGAWRRSLWSWVASRRISCSRMQIWPRPGRDCWPVFLPQRDRPVWLARARSCTAAFTIDCWPNSPSGQKISGSATPSIPRRKWGRWQRRRNSTRTSQWCAGPSMKAPKWFMAAGALRETGFPGGIFWGVYFYTPTFLRGVSPGSYIAQNEVFGPVLSVIPFDDEDEVIALANGTGFGLAAGIWSLNIRQAHRVANQLQAGTVWVNMYRAMSFNSPFGGYKASGIGRQNGIEAIDSYLQTKSIWCELSQEVQDPFVMRA